MGAILATRVSWSKSRAAMTRAPRHPIARQISNGFSEIITSEARHLMLVSLPQVLMIMLAFNSNLYANPHASRSSLSLPPSSVLTRPIPNCITLRALLVAFCPVLGPHCVPNTLIMCPASRPLIRTMFEIQRDRLLPSKRWVL